jgi:hypothetical protein
VFAFLKTGVILGMAILKSVTVSSEYEISGCNTIADNSQALWDAMRCRLASGYRRLLVL